MPLKAIKRVLDEDPDRMRALVELEDRVIERAAAGEETRVSAAELRRRYDLPKEVLDRLAELEVLTPNSRGYYDERIGFTVYDTLRYKRALEELVKEDVEVLLGRLAGKMQTERALKL